MCKAGALGTAWAVVTYTCESAGPLPRSDDEPSFLRSSNPMHCGKGYWLMGRGTGKSVPSAASNVLLQMIPARPRQLELRMRQPGIAGTISVSTKTTPGDN